ncbi:MAG: hypothetical protein QM784_37105 [Polyangiaceae bacterium]
MADSLKTASSTPELVAALNAQLAVEKDGQTLYKFVELAGLWVKDHPDLRLTVAKLAQTDLAPQVKRVIAGILAPAKS